MRLALATGYCSGGSSRVEFILYELAKNSAAFLRHQTLSQAPFHSAELGRVSDCVCTVVLYVLVLYKFWRPNIRLMTYSILQSSTFCTGGDRAIIRHSPPAVKHPIERIMNQDNDMKIKIQLTPDRLVSTFCNNLSL